MLKRDPETGIALPPAPCANTDTTVPPRINQCFCCVHHSPMYYKTHNYFVRPGETYWLCPVSMSNVKDLLKEYVIAGGEPDIYVQAYFTDYVLQIANRSWYLDKVARKKAKLRHSSVRNELNLDEAH